MPRYSDKINLDILENELSATDWELNRLVWELSWWTEFFQIAFFKKEPIPVPVLSFQRTRITTKGHYRIGRNSIGVKDNINLNRIYLDHPLWETLATLLHELVHLWEYTYLDRLDRTINWYHKRVFRDKLASFGIIADGRGIHRKIGDPFVHLMKQHGVDVSLEKDESQESMFVVPERKRPPGKSKLKKWTCGCTNVRVGIADFHAQCLKCGNLFLECG